MTAPPRGHVRPGRSRYPGQRSDGGMRSTLAQAGAGGVSETTGAVSSRHPRLMRPAESARSNRASTDRVSAPLPSRQRASATQQARAAVGSAGARRARPRAWCKDPLPASAKASPRRRCDAGLDGGVEGVGLGLAIAAGWKTQGCRQIERHRGPARSCHETPHRPVAGNAARATSDRR